MQDILALWHSPAAEQNKSPIRDVLQRVLPRAGRVLEIGSGSGQHSCYFSRAFPALNWQPSERDPQLRKVLALRVAREGSDNILAPVHVDVFDQPWPVSEVDVLLCINMLHVAPTSAVEALFDGADSALLPRSKVLLYGPFRRSGGHTAPSNAAFDADLRAQNPNWGIRDVEHLQSAAAGNGFDLKEVCDMPANNFVLVFERDPRTGASGRAC